jgi:small subunit ribosomal protein S4e
MSVLLRNRLKYALSGHEVLKIVKQKEGIVKVDQKIRRDPKFPIGFQDVVSIDKSGENFRMLYDVKGRFQPVPVNASEASWKLCKVVRKVLGKNKVPYIVTHDGRTIRYPHPDIKKNDTLKLNFASGDVETVLKFDNGATVFATGGNNIGRVGVLQHVEHHPGSYEIAHVRDSRGNQFATRLSNIFVIGQKEAMCSLPRQKGLKLTLIEERDKRDHRRRDDEEED